MFFIIYSLIATGSGTTMLDELAGSIADEELNL
jgi:hypothetical protein